MRTRSKVLIAGLVVLLMASALLIFLFFTDKYNRIRYGMPRDQVHSILGPPMSFGPNQPNVPNVIWEKEQRLVDLWSSEDGGMAVGYDPEGKVNFKDGFSHAFIPRTIRRLKRALGF